MTTLTDVLFKVINDLGSEDQSNKENRALSKWLAEIEADAEPIVIDCIESMVGIRIEAIVREALLDTFTVKKDSYLSESEDNSDEDEENEDDCSEADSNKEEESE